MKDLLFELGNGDGIASYEQEIRDIILKVCKGNYDEVYSDKLGSLIFHKKTKNPKPLKIMFCAHMDEVGFLVRHISDNGIIYLINVGNINDSSKDNQLVRISTNQGKVTGYMNTIKDSNGKIRETYIDLGVDSKEQVDKLGVAIGDMVTFGSSAQELSNDLVMSKALDDRIGICALIKAMEEIKEPTNDLYFVMTSSEEVGMRGAKTSTSLIKPDIIFAVDVANHHELVYNYQNHRQIGKGVMLEQYDKTMAPNRKLTSFVLEKAKTNKISYQLDMFGGGGTDAGNSHLVGDGVLAMVLGIPIRYCHSAYSIANLKDLKSMIELLEILDKELDKDIYHSFIDYIGGI